MLKKLFYVLICGIFVGNAFAVPTVKKLNANTTATTSKSVSVPRKSATKVNGAVVAKSAKTPVTKNVSGTEAARLPAVTAIKSIKTVSTNTVKPVDSNLIKPNVSEEEIKSIVNRIETLETQTSNAVVDVVENESGKYVTNIALDGNTLNVNKTNSVYVPVKNGNEITSEDAEIWIVK